MIGVDKQQMQKNVPNRYRRTALNVVVEKIGTSAVVHGDLGKESLKELLMSELSLISKFQSPETKDSTTPLENTSLTQAFSEIIAKGDKENISKESKSEEEVRELKIDNERKVVESDKEKQELKSTKDPMKFGKTSQEKDKNITEEVQKSQKDIFENEVTKKGEKEDQDMKNKTNQNDKTLLSDKGKDKIISSDEDSSIHGNAGKVTKKGDTKDQDKEKDSGKDTKIAEKNERQYRDKEIVTGKDEEREDLGKKQNKETETTKEENDKVDDDTKLQDKEKATLKFQNDKETIRETENVLQDKEKKEETDHTVKYLFRKKDSKLRGKKYTSEREKGETRRAIMKGNNSRYYGNLDDDEMKQIEEISDSEDFAEHYEKEERDSFFSKSSDNEDILALSYDGKWLRQYLKKPLILAMNEIVEKKPRDPVNYLGFWLLNYRKSQENLKRKMNLEEELLSKRNEWNVLHDQVKEMPKLIIEEKESKHQGEEENIEDWNFSNYRLNNFFINNKSLFVEYITYK